MAKSAEEINSFIAIIFLIVVAGFIIYKSDVPAPELPTKKSKVVLKKAYISGGRYSSLYINFYVIDLDTYLDVNGDGVDLKTIPYDDTFVAYYRGNRIITNYKNIISKK